MNVWNYNYQLCLQLTTTVMNVWEGLHQLCPHNSFVHSCGHRDDCRGLNQLCPHPVATVMTLHYRTVPAVTRTCVRSYMESSMEVPASSGDLSFTGHLLNLTVMSLNNATRQLLCVMLVVSRAGLAVVQTLTTELFHWPRPPRLLPQPHPLPCRVVTLAVTADLVISCVPAVFNILSAIIIFLDLFHFILFF